ncbi:MAG: hypothetical protein JNM93_09525, partial [Bacteriovoracaceae bacterium]|nr:hypothetical protein [Bacteriovoracaceae bacterium]
MKNVFLLLLFSILYASGAHACEVPYVVTFFTGIAMNDGSGDLATSSKMINELEPRLRAKYGDCLKIQVVFNAEPLKNLDERNEFSQWKRIRDFFKEGLFEDVSNELFTEFNGIVTPTNKIITKNKITFMTDETYLNSKLESDLQIQVSALREIDETSTHSLSKKILQKGKLTLIYEEAEGLSPSYGTPLPGDITYHYRTSYKNHNYVRVHTGVRSSGFYFMDETNYSAMKKSDLFKSFLNTEKYQIIGKNFINDEQQQIYHLYLSQKKGELPIERAFQSLRLAFEQSKAEPNKKFVLVQNIIDQTNINDLEMHFLKNDEQELYQFFKTKVSMVFQKNIPAHEFRSLQYHSKFPFVTGDMSLSDALNMGKIPLYEARNHKL